ncbi:hypothetical protein GCM10025881_35800 [Pseudolysinimonas kribbensis]|uniref:TIGR01777 family protein n=1 Tax=Pseudolysinimonas kribbensis TaxID=433641 RepID=A0ABQ6KER0_9MICO|nr:TIGR01777 family oxidoreductase [Pseudolysinimonas kribbensis]GMA96756.1 hypothetical protein GCM10025881_35800 [Pseudolysinimonas kribbensis]
MQALGDVDAVVNLSGASIARMPWTRGYRRQLLDSRVAATRTLADAMNQVRRPPAVFVSGSAVGIYGDRPGERLTEESARGRGFFPDLVEEWEKTSHLAPAATRVVQIRSGVVIARGGGMAPVRTLTGVGLGARFGTGGQHWPWISLHDEVAAIRHLLTRSALAGPVALVGPTPATSDRVTHGFARRMRRPYALRAPEGVIRRVLGEAGQRLLLDSMKVVPVRLQADGFTWTHPRVEDAIDAVFAA